MVEKDFLLKEYEECFAQVRVHDETQKSMIGFTITIASFVPTVLLALYQIAGEKINPIYWLLQSGVFFATFIALLVIFTYLVQNRLYFIYPARQLNAIRKYFLEKNLDFNNNRMYIDYNFSGFKWMSTHILILIGVATIASIFWIGAIFSLGLYIVLNNKFWISLVSGIIIFIVIISRAKNYLSEESKKSADEAIHQSKQAPKSK